MFGVTKRTYTMNRKRCAVDMAREPNRSFAETWEEVAISLQQTFCETLGDSDWESYKITEHYYMRQKVGYALFGPPSGDDSGEYDSCKLEKIKEICKILIEQDNHSFLEENSETWMSIIFVCLALEKTGNHTEVVTEPVFRVPRYCNENDITVHFIDRNGRIYESWKDYLQNNKLPSCSYCYPKGGVYHLNVNHQVEVEFGKTPARKLSSKICNGLDLATTFVSAGNFGLACAAMSFPVSAPILATSVLTTAVCSAYGIGRSTKEIIDRKKHKETIGLTNSASRNCWLSIVGNAVGILSCGASRIIPKIAQSGNALNMEGRVCVAALSVTSCTVSGINVANEILNLDEKRKKNDIRPSDVAQLISSVIFFGHSVLTTKTAFNLIREARQGRLEKFVTSVRSTKYRKVFSDLAGKIVGKKSELSESGNVIRSVKYIEEFGESFLNNVVVFKSGCNRASYIIDESGIRECVAYFRDLILNATRNFVTHMSNSFPQIGFGNHYENLTAASGKPQVPVADAGFNLRGQILTLLRGLGEFNIPLLLDLGVKIFSDLKYPLGRSICEVLNMIYMFVKEVVKDMENLYLEQLQEEKRLLGPNFSQVEFDQKYKISGVRFEYFCSVALKAVNLVGEVFSMLKEACLVTCHKVDSIKSERAQSPVFRDLVIPWEYTNSSENMPITKDHALQIARDLTSEDLNCNNSVVAYSESELFVIIEDKSIPLNVVRIKYIVECQIIYASVMC
ncbi:uncharacterized protein LOC124605264 [Schistocerca americana]|uniref:uncharacterized protein LOC124605264 n=1 Tax=Schistocerca americana TaxID=7009 RepID=UPI001F4F8FCA|nr:uncharacterized protein LOC124605264 [Schistocerca americana]